VKVVRLPIGDDPPTATLHYGASNLDVLAELPEHSVHTVCTSPPFWGLRDYGLEPQVWGGEAECRPQGHEWYISKHNPNPHGDDGSGGNLEGGRATRMQTRTGEVGSVICRKCGAWEGQLGLEPTPEMYVEHLVAVFDAVKRVLRPDGTLWLNLGDSYCSSAPGNKTVGVSAESTLQRSSGPSDAHRETLARSVGTKRSTVAPGLKPKDLVGIPWRVALALQADGWYLRNDIVWSKGSCMPESVRDRCTRSHEYIFLFAHPESRGRYFYDSEAIREAQRGSDTRPVVKPERGATAAETWGGTRNKRTVWDVNPRPYPGAHFAVWPPELVEPMILAGTSEKGCCVTCEAPYRRVAARKVLDGDLAREQPIGKSSARKADGTRLTSGTGHRTTETGATPSYKGSVVMSEHWEPSCDCQENTPVRCTVLDPFSGSGTTGYVALKHGRNYIGIDLGADYLELAERRIVGEKPLVEDDGSDLDEFDVFSLFEEG